jgi:hypothetical protein
VPNRSRQVVILGALLLLAAGLVWLLPADAVARSLFQSSPPVEESPTPEVPAVPTQTPDFVPPTPIPAVPGTPGDATPAVTSPTEPNPTPELPAAPAPAEAPTAEQQPIVAAPGYLPPPTLTAPGAFANGEGLPQLIGPRSSVASNQSGSAAEEKPAAQADSPSPAAELIDRAVSLLSYAWLCCGAGVVLGGALLMVWWGRRRPAS